MGNMLRWDTIYGVNHYHIYARHEGGDRNLVGESSVGEFNLLVIVDIDGYAGTVIFLSVCAVDGNNREGLLSSEVQWIVPFPAPTNVRIE
jgi:hypothetical protein